MYPTRKRLSMMSIGIGDDFHRGSGTIHQKRILRRTIPSTEILVNKFNFAAEMRHDNLKEALRLFTEHFLYRVH